MIHDSRQWHKFQNFDQESTAKRFKYDQVSNRWWRRYDAYVSSRCWTLFNISFDNFVQQIASKNVCVICSQSILQSFLALCSRSIFQFFSVFCESRSHEFICDQEQAKARRWRFEISSSYNRQIIKDKLKASQDNRETQR